MITKNITQKNTTSIQYGKQFKPDMSISLTELYKEIQKAQVYVDQLTKALIVFGDSDGSPGQDSELSWDSVEKKLTATHISCADLESDVSTGTPPLVVASSTLVNNLNADKWDGNEFGDYLDQDIKTTATPTLADLTISNLTASKMLSCDGSKKIIPTTTSGAITQTYSTTTQTHNNLTSYTLTDSTGGSANTTVAQVSDNSETTNNTTINDNFADITAQVNALRVDIENVKQLLNFVIDHGQTTNYLG